MFKKYIFVLLSLSIVLSSCGKSNDVVRASQSDQSESADSQVPTDHEERTKIPQSLGWSLPTKIAVGSAIGIGIAVVAIAGVVAWKIYATRKKWNEWNNDEEVGFKCVAENLGATKLSVEDIRPIGQIGLDAFKISEKPVGTLTIENLEEVKKAKSLEELSCKLGYEDVEDMNRKLLHDEVGLTEYFFQGIVDGRAYDFDENRLLVKDRSIPFDDAGDCTFEDFNFFHSCLDKINEEISKIRNEIEHPRAPFDKETHPKEYKFLSKVEAYLLGRYRYLKGLHECASKGIFGSSSCYQRRIELCMDRNNKPKEKTIKIELD
jgi:hypothetical protein